MDQDEKSGKEDLLRSILLLLLSVLLICNSR